MLASLPLRIRLNTSLASCSDLACNTSYTCSNADFWLCSSLNLRLSAWVCVSAALVSNPQAVPRSRQMEHTGRQPSHLDLRFLHAPHAAVVAWPLFLRAGTTGEAVPELEAAVGEVRAVDCSRDLSISMAVAFAGRRRRNGPPGCCCLSRGEVDSDLDGIMAGAVAGQSSMKRVLLLSLLLPEQPDRREMGDSSCENEQRPCKELALVAEGNWRNRTLLKAPLFEDRTSPGAEGGCSSSLGYHGPP